MPEALRDIAVVSNSFHLKPLIPLLYEDQHYHVLALTKNEVGLWEGRADGIIELDLAGVPGSIAEALGEETDVSRAGLNRHGGSSAGGQRVHGAGKGTDEEKDELRRYFREVDKAVTERLSRRSARPLILAAVDYYHPLFREVSKNPQLLADGITQDPKALKPSQLREAALTIFGARRRERQEEAVEEYGTCQARHQGSADLQEVCSAAAAGRVKRLLLEERKRLWGRLDRETGEVAVGGAPGNPDDADVLDDLAELTLTRGGEVMLVPQDQMPSTTGLAAGESPYTA